MPFVQIVEYKGVQGEKKYIPYSEYNTMLFGNGHSHYWHAATMKHLRRHLDMPLEASLGYFYADIFNRRAPSPAVLNSVGLPNPCRRARIIPCTRPLHNMQPSQYLWARCSNVSGHSWD